MNPTLVLLLLILALVLPVVGAAALRLLIPRLSARQFYAGAALIFAVAVSSVLLLARSPISDVQVAGLTVVLPVAGFDNSDLNLDGLGVMAANQPPRDDTPAAPLADAPPAPTSGVIVELTAMATDTAEPTSAPTAEPTEIIEPTAVPTEIAEPTVAPTNTPEPEPTAVPTEPPAPAPAERRTYVVKKGDTLRSIAAEYDVSVDDLLRVNNLTRKQGDSLRIDQELIIP